MESPDLDLSTAELIHERNLTQLDQPFRELSAACQHFDMAGYYQAVVQSTLPGSPVLARSRVMRVTWSSAYRLHRSRTIFPCRGGVAKVKFSQPACADATGVDKIRAYSLTPMSRDPEVGSPLERKYLEEKEALSNQTAVTFDCELFNQSASGFCFVYVSVTRNSSVVTEQVEQCVAAWPDSGEWMHTQFGGHSFWLCRHQFRQFCHRFLGSFDIIFGSFYIVFG